MSNYIDRTNLRFLIAGLVINLSLGVLYGWSILLISLEQYLILDRSTLSIVPSIGLLFFTLGVIVHDRLTRLLSSTTLAIAVMLGAGLGHLLFFLVPNYFSLLFGYGVIYGSSAGIGYGLALTFARNLPSKVQGWSIGSTVAAFALGGMIVSLLATVFPIGQNVQNVFGLISLFYFGMALLMLVLLWSSQMHFSSNSKTVEIKNIIWSGQFWRLAFTYFVMSYIGLMIVSHGAALMFELGVEKSKTSLTPFALNMGYIIGAILAGILIAKHPKTIIPVAFICISILSLLYLSSNLPIDLWFLAILCIGLKFGATVSIFVTLLTNQYGTDHAGELFGRINIGYGLAGFTAPIITAYFYELHGSYSLPLWIAMIMGALGILALSGSIFPKHKRSNFGDQEN